MSDILEELKCKLDEAEKAKNDAEEILKNKQADYFRAKKAYEQEFYKDKSCSSCKYNIVVDFSFDGWHNLCGNDHAPCTCCNHHCEYYQPDTIITKRIKDNIKKHTIDEDDIEALALFGFNIYEVYDEAKMIEDADKILNILKIVHNPSSEY